MSNCITYGKDVDSGLFGSSCLVDGVDRNIGSSVRQYNRYVWDPWSRSVCLLESNRVVTFSLLAIDGSKWGVRVNLWMGYCIKISVTKAKPFTPVMSDYSVSFVSKNKGSYGGKRQYPNSVCSYNFVQLVMRMELNEQPSLLAMKFAQLRLGRIEASTVAHLRGAQCYFAYRHGAQQYFHITKTIF